MNFVSARDHLGYRYENGGRIVDHSNLCMNCFSEIDEASGQHCSSCGWDNNKEQVAEALPYGTNIGSHYIIGRAKAMNGEGVTYAAFDDSVKQVVEMREFYPLSIAERNPVDSWIIPMAGYDYIYDEYLKEFVELAKNISRLKKVTVIHTVLDIIEQNQTAYICCQHIPSMTLGSYVKKSGVLTWNTVNNLFAPVITALSLLNSLGAPHLGVSPETIRVTTEGNLLVTGFSIADARKKGTALIEEIYDGFAAIEQYAADGICGESTDVYALAATMVFALSGTLPEPAPVREKDGRLRIPREYLKDLPPNVVKALANALQVGTDQRTASLEMFKAELSSASKIVTQVGGSPDAIRRLPTAEPEQKGVPPFVWLIITAVVTAVALAVVVMLWVNNPDRDKENRKVGEVSSAVTEEDMTPSMVGENLESWQQKLEASDSAYDFTIRVSNYHYSDTMEAGAIISQEPQADQPLPADRVVLVTVSRGSSTRVLPEVTGMTFEEMNLMLSEDGFVVEREDRSSADIAEGSVIEYKERQPGESLDYGSTVTLIVSTGPEEAISVAGTEE